jgi:hypothetical protein
MTMTLPAELERTEEPSETPELAPELVQAAAHAATEEQAAHARLEHHEAAARAALVAAVAAEGTLKTDLLERGRTELQCAARAREVRDAYTFARTTLSIGETPATLDLVELLERASTVESKP